MMIYVTSDDAEDSTTRKLEEVVFKGEKLSIGTKFFTCIKVSEADALEDRILAEAGEGAPRIIFLSRDYKVTDTLSERQLSAGKILKAMERLVRAEYENNFNRMVSGYAKLLNELDRLEGKKAQLADKRARLRDKPNKSKEKKLAREEAQLEVAYEKWQAKEQELLSFQKKGERKAEA